MDAVKFETMMREHVMPAARKAFPNSAKITIQFDNAPGHKTKNVDPTKTMAASLERDMRPLYGRPEIVFGKQIPNSPDTNACDLGFFKSMDSRIPKNRSMKLDEFEKQCLATFKDYPSEILNRLFETKTLVCKCIVGAGGDNTYKLPHRRDFA